MIDSNEQILYLEILQFKDLYGYISQFELKIYTPYITALNSIIEYHGRLQISKECSLMVIIE